MTDLTNPIFVYEDKARAHLERLRWPGEPVCPHCRAPFERIAAVANAGKRTKTVPKGKKHRPARKGLYYCNSCNEQFTVQVGTVLEKSHVPLHKWLAAFYLMCASKKGISVHQLHRTLSVSYKTAWFMAHRIREAMRTGGLAPPMGGSGGVVGVDETIYGRAALRACSSTAQRRTCIGILPSSISATQTALSWAWMTWNVMSGPSARSRASALPIGGLTGKSHKAEARRFLTWTRCRSRASV